MLNISEMVLDALHGLSATAELLVVPLPGQIDRWTVDT